MKPLSTERLQLVPPSMEFAEDVLEYASSTEFCRYIDAPPAQSMEDATNFLHGLIDANNNRQRKYWLILADKKCIGSLGFNYVFNPKHRTQDFGYGLSPDYWGQGIFSEAATAVLRYGFDVLGLERIQALTRADNTRSVQALNRLGFINEATLKSFYQLETGRADCVLSALIRSALPDGENPASHR